MDRSGGEYSGEKRRVIHVQAESVFLLLDAVRMKKKHFVHPINLREDTMVNFIISSKSSEEMSLTFSLA